MAIVLGAWQLYAKKGDATNRYVGYVWVLGMLYVSISSFWIHEIKTLGGFSFIHILSGLTPWILYKAVRAAQQHDIAKHQTMMQRFYVLGLVIAGLLSFLPGRAMHTLMFS